MKTHHRTSSPRTSQADFTVETINSRDELARFAPEWREFLGTPVVGMTYYNDPEFALRSLAENPRAEPLVVTIRSGGTLRCIAPCWISRTKFPFRLSVIKLGSLPIRMLSVYGDHFVWAKTDDPQPYLNAVFSTIAAQRRRFDMMTFQALVIASPTWDYCAETLPTRHPFRFVRASSHVGKIHKIQLPETHDAYMASHSPKTRQNLRRLTRRFFEDGRARLDVITAPGQVPSFLEHLDGLYPRTWQAKTFGAVPRNTEAARRHLETAARHGWLRAYLLLRDDVPVAYELGFHYQGVYYGDECGFDQDFAEASPGSVVIHLAIEDLLRTNAPEVVDFGFGESAYKRSFGNVELDASPVYLVPANRWRWILRVHALLDLLFHSVRSASIRLGLDRRLRRLLKRQR